VSSENVSLKVETDKRNCRFKKSNYTFIASKTWQNLFAFQDLFLLHVLVKLPLKAVWLLSPSQSQHFAGKDALVSHSSPSESPSFFN
jgi:hypothetical protein